MNNDRVNSDKFHQHDVTREVAFKHLVDHGVTAILDDDAFALVTLNVWQRFRQDVRDVWCVIKIYWHRPSDNR